MEAMRPGKRGGMRGILGGDAYKILNASIFNTTKRYTVFTKETIGAPLADVAAPAPQNFSPRRATDK